MGDSLPAKENWKLWISPTKFFPGLNNRGPFGALGTDILLYVIYNFSSLNTATVFKCQSVWPSGYQDA